MIRFFLGSILSYDFILIAAAVIPAVFLMIRVYRKDRLEKESGRMLIKLVFLGILSALLAMVEEWLFSYVLDLLVSPYSVLYNIITYFVIVAIAEESSKYLLLKKGTWKSPEFNCQFDGVVYSVFVSLGFALWENISYVLSYGFSTAIIRAVTAIPGHASFGVFMGVFYGLARRSENYGDRAASIFFRVLSVAVPALLHGTYDYIATMQSERDDLYFIGFIAIMFIISFITIGRASKKDRFI